MLITKDIGGKEQDEVTIHTSGLTNHRGKQHIQFDAGGESSCVREADFNQIDVSRKSLTGRNKRFLGFLQSMYDDFISSRKKHKAYACCIQHWKSYAGAHLTEKRK